MSALLQGGAEVAEGAGEAAAGGHFEPFLPGLILLPPFLGFLINGALALAAGLRAADATRAGGEWELPESDRPATHTLPSLVGPGVMLGAFLVVLVNFVRMYPAHLEAPVVVPFWTWLVTGTFQ